MQPYTVASKSSSSSKKGGTARSDIFMYDRWCLFNDDKVTLVSEGDVLNADAYLLFYTLRSLSFGK